MLAKASGRSNHTFWAPSSSSIRQVGGWAPPTRASLSAGKALAGQTAQSGWRRLYADKFAVVHERTGA